MAPSDLSWQRLAAAYIYRQLNILQDHLSNLSNRDAMEPLHQVRVTSRRLRAGLRVFEGCFAAGKVRIWCKTLRKLTRRLGEARDLDIAISYLDDVLNRLEDKACRPGIKRLRLRLDQQRQASQSHVDKAATLLDRKGVLDEMLSEVGRIRYGTRRHHPPVSSDVVVQQGRKKILERLADVKILAGSLRHSDAIEEHHQMRIAIKGLRYTMEIFRRIFPKRLERSIKDARKLQTLLGDLHDADMWRDVLNRFSQDERERTEAYFGHVRSYNRLRGGINYLLQEQLHRRQTIFEKLQRYWEHLENEHTWEALEESLRASVVNEAKSEKVSPTSPENKNEQKRPDLWPDSLRIKPAS